MKIQTEKSYPKTIHSEDLWLIIQKIHHNEMDIWEGDIYPRLYLHYEYELKKVPIDSFCSDRFEVDGEMVEEYKELPLDTMPPIVLTHLDEKEYLLIDGTHRTKTMIVLGEKEIWAYVGVGEPDWESLEEDDEDEE